VIIAIIGILASITAVVGFKLKDNGKVAKTRTALAALQGLATEYEASTQTKVNTAGDTPFDWSQPVTKNARNEDGTLASGSATITESISQFFYAANQVPGINANLVSVGKDLIQGLGGTSGATSPTGFIRVVDAWGNAIVYSDGANPVTEAPFIPTHNRPFFASAGPDGKWGDSADSSQLTDNLYSFEIDQSEGARRR
jgi:hypothetical protein